MFKIGDKLSEDFRNPHLQNQILRLMENIWQAILFDRANISD